MLQRLPELNNRDTSTYAGFRRMLLIHALGKLRKKERKKDGDEVLRVVKQLVFGLEEKKGSSRVGPSSHQRLMQLKWRH